MFKFLQRIIVMLLVFTMVVSCAGRAAAPVSPHRYGDEKKSCRALENEISFTESEIQRLIPKTEKTGTNVALGIAGVFFLVPWFFMDLSKAEQIEVNALRHRYNNLVIIANEKECYLNKEEIPDFKKQQKQKNKN